MKKLSAIVFAIYMMASVLCTTVFAADTSASATVLRVSALKGGEIVVINDYDNFQDGWNDAMKIAGDNGEMKDNGYERIVVDLYDDWSANTDGEFTDEIWNGAGFDNDTIYIPEDAKVTLNMNGHTIDRGLTDDEDDGEVIFVNDDADVIIKDGTITGGYSNSEGGCLYMEGSATVTLNNVNIIGNAVTNDNGAAIYMYSGATLVVNGGSISNNFVDEDASGVVCAMDSTVILNDVTIDGNYTNSYSARGLAVYADRSTVKMSNCTVSNNATKDSVVQEIIYAKNSSLTITNTDFINNNTLGAPQDVADIYPNLFYLEDSDLTMVGGNITGNGSHYLFNFYGAGAEFTDVTIKDNKSAVMDVNNGNEVIYMTRCTLNSNFSGTNYWGVNIKKSDELVMTDCDHGNTTFSNMNYVETVIPAVSKEEAMIGIRGILADGTNAFTEYYKSLSYGWSFAMEHALSGAYDRVIVDLYADWTSDENGNFTDSSLNGKGFYDYTILIPEEARITLNLNGHTIKRLLANAKENGEVILIEKEADVIINDGTISGGFSSNSAGGIHINGFATVTLNNVCIFDNESSKTGNGAGIALYDCASLTMNGGSFTENRVQTTGTLFAYGGAWASLNNVTINDNRSVARSSEGVAIAASNRGAIFLNDCVVSGNAVDGGESVAAESIVVGWNATLVFTNTVFTDNGSTQSDESTYLFYCYQSGLTVREGSVTNNHTSNLFNFSEAGGIIERVTITDNAARTLTIYNINRDTKVTLRECTLNNNKPTNGMTEVEVMTEGTLSLIDCNLGDTVFEDKNMATGVGSMFGEGSLTMIVALLALVTSGVAIFLIADMKKKLSPMASNNSTETEDEE